LFHYELRPFAIGGVLRLGFPFSKLFIKYGTSTSLNEATALRFVASNTSIRVPEVYCAFEYDDVKFILMEWIDGVPIKKAWLNRPEAERDDMMRQLRGYFDQLKAIPHPLPGAIAADMQSLFDPRLAGGECEFGPFANEKDFNKYLRSGVHANSKVLHSTEPKCWMRKDEQDEIKKMIAMQDTEGHKICFSHGNPNTYNILVKGNKVVALIDFEMAGFYPEYWDYCRAMNVGNVTSQFWKDEVGKFLTPYPAELEMERIRRKYFSFWGFCGRAQWA